MNFEFMMIDAPLPPATLLWTCHLGTPCVASCSQPTSFTKSLYTLTVE